MIASPTSGTPPCCSSWTAWHPDRPGAGVEGRPPPAPSGTRARRRVADRLDAVLISTSITTMPTGARCDGSAPRRRCWRRHPEPAGFSRAAASPRCRSWLPGSRCKIGKVEIAAVEAEHGHGRAPRSVAWRRSDSTSWVRGGSTSPATPICSTAWRRSTTGSTWLCSRSGDGPNWARHLNPERRSRGSDALAADRRPDPLGHLLPVGLASPTTDASAPRPREFASWSRDSPRGSRCGSCLG